jgi:NADH-quinone oxidoreductase subunit N
MKEKVLFDPLSYEGLYPEYLLLSGVIAICLLGFFLPRQSGGLSLWVALISLALAFFLSDYSEKGMVPKVLRQEPWIWILKRYFCVSAIVLLFSWLEWKQVRNLRLSPLFSGLVLMATLSMSILVQAKGLWMLILAAEGFSFAAYALIINTEDQKKTAASALRYFGVGAIATAFSVFGMSWILGFQALPSQAAGDFGNSVAFFPVAGAVFFLGFILFKMACFPFQFWLPAVYESAPTPITGFIASAPKVAAGFACLNLVQELNINLGFPILCFALSTAIFGNLAAFQSRTIKELIAYSSIGQAAFLLIPQIFAPRISGAGSQLLYFSLVYGTAIQALFSGCQYLESKFGFTPEIADLSGFGRNHILPSMLFLALLLSIIGIPPFAGFTAKLLIISGLPVGEGLMGHAWPSVLFGMALLITILAAGYFFRIPERMFLGNLRINFVHAKNQPAVSVIIMVLGLLFQLVAFFIPSLFFPEMIFQ